jgi:hypothetical protein
VQPNDAGFPRTRERRTGVGRAPLIFKTLEIPQDVSTPDRR